MAHPCRAVARNGEGYLYSPPPPTHPLDSSIVHCRLPSNPVPLLPEFCQAVVVIFHVVGRAFLGSLSPKSKSKSTLFKQGSPGSTRLV